MRVGIMARCYDEKGGIEWAMLSIAIKEVVEQIGRAIGQGCQIHGCAVRAVALMCELRWKPLKTNPPLFRRRFDWFIQNRSFKIDAARRDFGYNPSIPLD